MSILEIKGLSHTFDGKLLFDKADLTVNNGEHIGVVGLNGAGKSTFINIIGGKLPQDAGEVLWSNNIRKGYLDQHANIDRGMTVMEYLKTSFSHLYELNAKMESTYERMNEPDADLDALINKANRMLDELTTEGFFDLEAEIKKVANGLGVGRYGFDTPVAELSGGMRAKLMLTKLLLSKPDIMMLDEPTNFLDIEHIAWLVDYLNSVKGTFMVISHDTDFLNKVSKCIVSIENGHIRKYSGNYKQYEAQAEMNRKQYAENYERQQREIERMEDYINRNKARAATAGMANARKKQLEKMELIKRPTIIYDAVFSFPYTPLHTREIVSASGLAIGYGEPLLPPIDFSIDSETKLWIRGTNGIGKTTLLKTLTGNLKPLGGAYSFHPFAKIGYVEQDLNFPNPEETATSYFSGRFPRYDTKKVRAALAGVGIKNDLATKAIRNLSGGEQVRIKLAVIMNADSNILILDEPTNHLDVRAKAALKEALIAYPGALILVSHEMDFAGEICGKILDVKI